MRNILAEETNREKLEFSLTHRVSQNLQIGLEHGADSNEYFPLINYRLREAKDGLPAFIVGTSSAWPSGEVDGNAFFLSAASLLNSRTSGSVSISYTPDDGSWKIPGSLQYALSETVDGSLIWDGDNLHPLVTWYGGKINLSFILLGGEDPTISTTIAF